MVRQGKRATHKCPRIEGGISGPEKIQRPVSKSNSVVCNGQLNSSSLHKQTRRNPLGRDVCSPVENHDLVPSLPDNSKSQARSRVSECDGQPTPEWSLHPQVFKQICQKRFKVTTLSWLSYFVTNEQINSPWTWSKLECMSLGSLWPLRPFTVGFWFTKSLGQITTICIWVQ